MRMQVFGVVMTSAAISPSTASAPDPKLRRELGKWDLTAIGVNQVIGSAIFTLAAEGEKYRLQLIALQNFISLTWKAKGQ